MHIGPLLIIADKGAVDPEVGPAPRVEPFLHPGQEELVGEAGHLVSPGQARRDVHVDDVRPAGEFPREEGRADLPDHGLGIFEALAVVPWIIELIALVLDLEREGDGRGPLVGSLECGTDRTRGHDRLVGEVLADVDPADHEHGIKGEGIQADDHRIGGFPPDSIGFYPVHRDLVCPDRLKDRDGSPDCTLLGCRGDHGHIGKRCQGFVGSPEPGGVYSVIIREQDRWLHLSW